MRVLLVALAAPFLLLIASGAAHAVDPVHLQDPKLEARYQTLIHELRCVECQTESLADSQVDVAGELRAQVRRMLLAGKTDDEIRNYFVSRYSEFILFKPRYSLRNAWLWLLPVALLLIGAAVAARVIRARAALVDQDDQPVEDAVHGGPRGGTA